MSEIITPRTLSGFMELLPKDRLFSIKIRNTLEKNIYKLRIFPRDTPILEDSKILLAKAGGELKSRFTDSIREITDLTMRLI